MQAVTVVIGFDVLENGLFHGIPCGKSFTVDAFYFQGVEKALGAGVVIAISFGTHAAMQLVLLYQLLVSVGAILAATVGMDNHALRMFTYASRVPFSGHHTPTQRSCVDP